MKKSITLLAAILLVVAGCGGGKQSDMQNDGFITVDVTKSYPKKELILQDFMDVEYIPLESTDEFVCQGSVQAIGKDIILVKNHNNDGDIFFFDRNGKGIKKINRMGQGGEEYINIAGIIFDENKGEIFVNSLWSKKILVYDIDGIFLRSYSHEDNTSYQEMYNLDRENLILYDASTWRTGRPCFVVVSKQDGSITKEILIPFKEKKTTMIYLVDEANDMTYASGPRNQYPIIPYFDNWILADPSSDTMYCYSNEHKMKPFITRTPSVQSMDPEVFLSPSIITDRYYFMESVKKEYDFDSGDGFPTTDLMYDKKEKAIFKYTVYNDDYSDKRVVNMKSISVNDEIATWQILEAHHLIADYKNGKLKGRLKEIATELEEDSNPVIMLIKHKLKLKPDTSDNK